MNGAARRHATRPHTNSDAALRYAARHSARNARANDKQCATTIQRATNYECECECECDECCVALLALILILILILSRAEHATTRLDVTIAIVTIVALKRRQ